MRPLAIAACLLAGSLLVPLGAADPLWSGPFAGTVADGETDVHGYSTHPDFTLCAAIYIPHTFVVTLNAAPTDSLSLSVGSQTATTTAGVATLTFVANYCTSFDISVTGVAVQAGAYAVVVEHANQVNVLCCLA